MQLGKYWTVGKLARVVEGKILRGSPELPLSSVSIDSRELARGAFFWALPGAKAHGNEFVSEVAKKGAMGALVTESPAFNNLAGNFAVLLAEDSIAALGRLAGAHRRLFPQLETVAVTGSNGKTTTKEMIAAVLACKAPTFHSPGNYNTEIGCPLSLLHLDQGYAYGVFELGAKKRGDIAALSALAQPSVAVVTCIAPAHLETFGSMENIWQTKLEIVQGLAAGGTLIYWAEDPWLGKIAKLGLTQKLMSFGFSGAAHLRGELRRRTPDGLRLEVFYKDRSQGLMQLKLLSQGQARNVLAAFACGLVFGLKPQAMTAALSEFEAVSMRGRKVVLGGGAMGPDYVLIDDTYNANPESVFDGATAFLDAYPGGTRFLMLGEMRELGHEEVKLHQETAQRIFAYLNQQRSGAQTIFIFAGGALAEAMAETWHPGKEAPGNVRVHCVSREKAADFIKQALAQQKPPCAVFLKASRAEAFDKIARDIEDQFKHNHRSVGRR